jgi:hypothetical protein
MRQNIKWAISALLLLVAFGMTFMRSPDTISNMLSTVAADLKIYAVFVHVAFFIIIVLGFGFKKMTNTLWAAFTAFLSLSATIIALRYMVLPNIIVFGMYFILIVHAYFSKQLVFDVKHLPTVNLIFGVLGWVFGFWYLHWVDSPVALNALLFSPLGVVNCPTMLTICGFLCISSKPRSILLEATAALTTLYFGFYGLFRLGAYIDIVLIVCALFLMVRLGSYFSHNDVLKKAPY